MPGLLQAAAGKDLRLYGGLRCRCLHHHADNQPSQVGTGNQKIGQEIGGEKFLIRDFKKKDGFKRAVQLAKQWELYRQDYCGCTYSMRQRKGQKHVGTSLQIC